MIASKKQWYLAMDLGTTNTVVAYGQMNGRTGALDAQVVKLKVKTIDGVRQRSTVSSVVFYDKLINDNIVSTVGEYAKHMRATYPNQTVASVKSRMGQNWTFEYENNKFTPSQISYEIIKFALDNVRETLKTIPEDIIITVPASFDTEMRTATIEAARLAGVKLKNSDGTDRNILLDEPTAALYNFIDSLEKNRIPDVHLDISTPKNIMVFDLGGGTLDVSFHKVWRNEEKDIKVSDYAISLHTLLGGDDFDSLFSNYLYKKIEDRIEKLGLNEFEMKKLHHTLTMIAEETKMNLSDTYQQTKLHGLGGEVYTEIIQSNVVDNIPLEEIITAESYEEVVKSLMGYDYNIHDVAKMENGTLEEDKNIIYPILDVLAKARARENKDIPVDAVLLNGGMTRMWLVQDRLKDFFGLEPITIQDPDLSVAFGGVYYHHRLHKGEKRASILNDSIGIEVEGGEIEHLAKAGVTLPYKYTYNDKFTISKTGQTVIDIPFYIGSGKKIGRANRKIADRSVRLINPLKKGDCVSIEISIDELKILHVCGWINGNDRDKFVMEVNSNNIEEPLRGNGGTPSIPRPVIPTKYVDSNINPMSLNHLSQLKNYCKKYSNTNIQFMHQNHMKNIREYETLISQCSDKMNAISILTRELKSYDYSEHDLYKKRIVLLIGRLMQVTGLNDDFFSFAKIELDKRFISNNTYYATSKQNDEYLRYQIEALGKSKSRKAGSYLHELLKVPYYKNEKHIAYIMISLGKTFTGVEVFERIINILKTNRTARTEALWAIGKLGSRQAFEPINILDIEQHLDTIMSIAREDANNSTRRHAFYALAEICDSRGRENVISRGKANEIIRFVETEMPKLIRNDQGLVKLLEITRNLVQGNTLSTDDEKCLLAIRESV